GRLLARLRRLRRLLGGDAAELAIRVSRRGLLRRDHGLPPATGLVAVQASRCTPRGDWNRGLAPLSGSEEARLRVRRLRLPLTGTAALRELVPAPVARIGGEVRNIDQSRDAVALRRRSVGPVPVETLVARHEIGSGAG